MPILFKIPYLNLEVPAFGLMMTVGFFLAIWWAVQRAIRSGANPDVVLNMGFIALIGGVVGCRIMYVAHYPDLVFAGHPTLLSKIWAAVNLTKGGMEYYGGFIASVVGVLVYLHFWGHSKRWYFDIVAPSVAVGMAFGRIGCFLNGCCFGGVCELPWAVKFPYGSNPAAHQFMQRLPGAELPAELIHISRGLMAQPIPIQSFMATDAEIEAAFAKSKGLRAEIDEKTRAAQNAAGDEKKRLETEVAKLQAARLKLPHAEMRTQLDKFGLTMPELRALAHKHPSNPVHPTQLYSTAGLLVLAWLLGAVYWRRTRDGQVICLLFAIEPVSRWLLEMIRSDNPHDAFGLTISQFLAIVLTLIGILGLLILRNLPPRSPRAKIWVPEPEPAPSSSRKRNAATA